MVAPAIAIDFKRLVTGDVPAGFTFSRSAPGTYFDASGVLQTAATNVLRISRDPVSGELGYLAEPGRTNLCQYTNDVSNLAWTNYIQGSGVAPVSTGAYAIAPDGTMTATRVDLDCGGSTSNDRCLRRMQYASATIGVSYSGAIWLKAATAGDVGKTVRVHLENAGPTNVIYTLTANWVRVLLNAGSATATTTSINLYVECRGTYSSQSASVLMWGGQIESGSYASSDIPNPGSGTMSRGADLLTTTLSAAHAAALSVAGTMVARFSFLGGDSTVDTNARVIACLDGGSSANRNFIYNQTAALGAFANGANNISIASSGTVATNTPTKYAYAFATNDAAASKNGASVNVDAGSADVPPVTTLTIGSYSYSTSVVFGGLIHDFRLHTSRLTNAQLQALTDPRPQRMRLLTSSLSIGI